MKAYSFYKGRLFFICHYPKVNFYGNFTETI
nr:MAG TPA: hypothetical protein [Caudoviricetes sp.]DAU54136.1 MAG TPA: hypothetical protein [Caudoviricetes sp.]